MACIWFYKMAVPLIPRRITKKPISNWTVWIGLLPFFFFGLAFEFLPLLTTIRSSLTSKGILTLEFYRQAMQPIFLRSFGNTFKISATTALLGMVLGTLVAYAIVTTGNKFIQNALTALSDVTTNFGGAPLAFAFIVILGSTGIITLLLKQVGIHLYPNFRIYSISGLTIAYLYFQLPLMILLIIPSLHGLKREWHEAALNLGASSYQYWVRVALPILFPSLASGFLLLFAADMKSSGADSLWVSPILNSHLKFPFSNLFAVLATLGAVSYVLLVLCNIKQFCAVLDINGWNVVQYPLNLLGVFGGSAYAQNGRLGYGALASLMWGLTIVALSLAIGFTKAVKFFAVPSILFLTIEVLLFDTIEMDRQAINLVSGLTLDGVSLLSNWFLFTVSLCLTIIGFARLPRSK